jgi:hypothetical protein
VDKLKRTRERHCAGFGHAWKRVAEAERVLGPLGCEKPKVIASLREAANAG